MILEQAYKIIHKYTDMVQETTLKLFVWTNMAATRENVQDTKYKETTKPRA